MRRVLYLYQILNRKEDSLLHKFFVAQLENETHGDWASQVLQDLQDLQINLKLSEIAEMSEHRFKTIVKKEIIIFSMKYLNGMKLKHEHIKHFRYEDNIMASYLTSTEICNSEKKFIFACRSGDLDLKGCKPWFYKNTTCICCKLEIENFRHIIDCSELIGKSEIVTYIPCVEDLTGSLDELIYLCRIIKDNMKRRKDYIDV